MAATNRILALDLGTQTVGLAEFQTGRDGGLILTNYKTGELLGIMVNNDYCALLKNFSPAKTIRTGPDVREQATGALFNDIIARVRSMPLKLQ